VSGCHLGDLSSGVTLPAEEAIVRRDELDVHRIRIEIDVRLHAAEYHGALSWGRPAHFRQLAARKLMRDAALPSQLCCDRALGDLEGCNVAAAPFETDAAAPMGSGKEVAGQAVDFERRAVMVVVGSVADRAF